MKLQIIVKIETPQKTIYFTKDLKEHESINYRPGLISITAISNSISEDRSYNAGLFQVTVIDREGILRGNLNLKNKSITIIVEDKAKGVQLYQVKGKILKFRPGPGWTVIFEASQAPAFLDKEYPEKSIQRDGPESFPDAAESAFERPLQELYGMSHTWHDLENPHPDGNPVEGHGAIECPLLIPDGPNEKPLYFIASHPVAHICAWDAGVLISPGATYFQDPETSYSFVEYQPEIDTENGEELPEFIRINTHGKSDSYGGNFLIWPIIVLQEFCNTHNIPYDSSSFQNVHYYSYDRGDHISLPIIERTRLYDIIAGIAINFNFFWFINDDLEIELTLPPSAETESIYKFDKSVIIEGSFQHEGITDPINRLHGNYDFIPAVNAFYSQYEEIDRLSYDMYGENPAELDLYFLIGSEKIKNREQIWKVMREYLNYNSAPREKFSFSIPLITFVGSQVKLGSVIEVEHSDTWLPGSAKYQVIGVTKNILNQTVNLKVRGIEGLPFNKILHYAFARDLEDTARDECRNFDGNFVPANSAIYGNAIYGNYIDLSPSGYIEISPLRDPETDESFPWVELIGGEQNTGATVAFWIGRDGVYTMGSGVDWSVYCYRRIWVEYDTTNHPGELFVRYGACNTPGAEIIVSGDFGDWIHIILFLMPYTGTISMSYLKLYMNGEYKATSQVSVPGIGAEIVYIGKLVGSYTGMLRKVSHTIVLRGELTDNEKRILGSR